MTVAELETILEGRAGSEEVRIDGFDILRVSITPDEEGLAGYVDITPAMTVSHTAVAKPKRNPEKPLVRHIKRVFHNGISDGIFNEMAREKVTSNALAKVGISSNWMPDNLWSALVNVHVERVHRAHKANLKREALQQ